MTIERILVAAVFAALLGAPAKAQQGTTDCDPYFQVVAASNAKAPAVVPDALLADASRATSCLAAVVGSLNPSPTATSLAPDASSKLLSATAALRTLMTKGSIGPSGSTSPELAEFIERFRKADNLDVISALSFAGVSDNYDLRVNAVLILGNVIDNATVCVPLTRLNDQALASTTYGVNGRANLLGVVSVVAPWAYRENFDSIAKTVQSIRSSIGDNDPNFRSTRGIIDNIKARLASQNANSNQSVAMNADQLRQCGRYVENFGQRAFSAGNLSYSTK